LGLNKGTKMKFSFEPSKSEKRSYSYEEMLNTPGVYTALCHIFIDAKFVSLGQGEHLFLFKGGTKLERKYNMDGLREAWGNYRFTKLNESFNLHIEGD
jgi:hypothetical protein